MSATPEGTNWQVEYDDPGPVRIRDPVAEVLGVVREGDPIVVDYRSVIAHAGHSCPAAAGGYRLSQVGLDALYPDSLPVRSEVTVTAAGPKGAHPYGVISGIISHVTGASDERGFGGLKSGYGNRQGHLAFDGFEADGIAFEFARTDTDEAVRVSYQLPAVPRPEGLDFLGAVLEGSATEDEVAAFRSAWHERVRAVLSRDEFFEVERTTA